MMVQHSIQSFLLTQISSHAKDIVTFAARQLSVSRMTIYRHLKKLIKKGEIIQTGNKRGVQYFLKSEKNKKLSFKITPELTEFDVWKKNFQEQFLKLPKNVFDICEYGFTEIFNNAIEHSEGKQILVTTGWNNNSVKINIGDDGIGIFRKLQDVYHFDDLREGILALSKGKFTTDPENHTGEGIFFTSRAFDLFVIKANGLTYLRDNLAHDWIIESVSQKEKGSLISMEIKMDSKRKISDLFRSFQDENSLSFDKTNIYVELSRFNEENFISRSQAKRILFGLEKFKRVVLDFKGVSTVGQGFVDEVFRVFKNKYPKIQIDYVHANQDVEFMIKRGILPH